MRHSSLGTCILFAALGCSSATRDYFVVDNCTPGISVNAICSVSVRLAGLPDPHIGGLVWIDRTLQTTPGAAGYVLQQSATFTTTFTDLLQFAEKTLGAAPKQSSDNPVAFDVPDTYYSWTVGDGTWVLARDAHELSWYSVAFPRIPTPEYMKVAAERAELRPAPVSGPIWRALGRFIIDHPAQP